MEVIEIKSLPKRVKKVKKAKKIKRQFIKRKVVPKGRSKVFLPEKLEELLEKGRKRGFVTYSEILYFFPEIERDIKGIDKLYEDLEREGIEVKEVRELLSLEEKKPRKTKAGEARIDPVQMYLKEMLYNRR